jgi:hypothetical protein
MYTVVYGRTRSDTAVPAQCVPKFAQTAAGSVSYQHGARQSLQRLGAAHNSSKLARWDSYVASIDLDLTPRRPS